MSHWKPAQVLVFGYLLYSVIGALLLALPFTHQQSISFLDDWFIAVSASSTSGLATIDIGSAYNFLGQVVIAVLMQLGGIGYMTFSSFILLYTTGALPHFRRKIGVNVLPVPKDFSMKEFLHSVILFTFVAELIGAIALSIIFYTKGVDQWFWNGIFHSISAFCTVGLSLFSDGFVPFQNDFWLNLVISLLAILGALGFIIVLDCYKNWTGQKKSFSFTSKVILVVTASILIVGTIGFFCLEPNHWMYAFFQVMAGSTTAGFNTIDIGTLRTPALILLVFCSTFGSAPSGTGGGLKNTTFAILLVYMKNMLRGHPITLWNREIPAPRVKIATVTFVFYTFCMFAATFVLSIIENRSLISIFFETANAINNSGMSMNLTPDLTEGGKVIISLLMLIGRAGVLTFGLAISLQAAKPKSIQKPEEIIL